MKRLQSILILSLLFATTGSAQNPAKKGMLVKHNGDTLYFDNITAGSKNYVCKKDGQEKVKIPSSEVSHYYDDFTYYIKTPGELNKRVDTIAKYVLPKGGLVQHVRMENDSVYLTSMIKDVNGVPFFDYFIIRKKDNTQIMKIKKDKSAPGVMKKYFGGSCAVFDAKLDQVTPEFQKAKFPYREWDDLLWLYERECMNK